MSMFKVRKCRWTCQIALCVALAVVTVGDSFIIQMLMDAVQRSQWNRFGWLCALSVVWIVLHVFAFFYRSTDADKLANAMIADLRNDLIDRLDGSVLVKASDNADLLYSQFASQLEVVKRDYLDTLLWALYLLCQLALSVVAVVWLNPVLAAVALVLCIPMAFVPVLAKRVVERARRRLSSSVDELNDATGDVLHGLVDWRLADAGRWFLRSMHGKVKGWLLAANHEATVRQGVDTVSHSLTIVVVFGVWIGGGLLIMQGTMFVPQIVAFYSLIGNISVPLFQMSGLVAQYHAGAAVLERVRRTFDECVSPAGLPAGSHQEPDTGQQASTGSGVHVITYRGVRFHTRQSESSRTQTPGISVTLRTDRRYLVVGPSGAGKSSLIRPLFRLDDDYQGTITVDGADLRTMGDVGIGAMAGLLSQASHIFNASVRENIRMMDERIGDRSILDACDQAMIGDWVRRRGLDTVIDNTLTSVSGGERQRLLLARLLVRKPAFCVFDELVTGLDNRTAAMVEETVFRAVQGFVYITHHINDTVLEHVDEVLVITKQGLTEFADPDQARPMLEQLGLLA